MYEHEILVAELKKYLVMNVARINFIAGFIIAVLKAGTVNLAKIAIAFPGTVLPASQYKKLQRFFRYFPLDLLMIGKLIGALILNELESFIIAIDRTNWKFGNANINILTLAIVYKDISIPLVWNLLPKRGNSNSDEKIALLELFKKIFPFKRILCLTADREFIGGKWFGYMIENEINFCIRIKENICITNSKGYLIPAKSFFRDLKPCQFRILEGKKMVLGYELFVIGILSPNGSYVILVTNQNPEKALEYYRQRWTIETLFGCLKSKGFNFEDTHITELKRLEKLFALISLAFCWCLITGEWISNKKEIKVKKHGRKSIGIFRLGYNYIRHIMFNIYYKINEFINLVNLLMNMIDDSARFLNAGGGASNFLSCT